MAQREMTVRCFDCGQGTLPTFPVARRCDCGRMDMLVAPGIRISREVLRDEDERSLASTIGM